MTLMSVRGLEYMDSVVISRELLCMTVMSADMYSAGVTDQRADVYDWGGHLKKGKKTVLQYMWLRRKGLRANTYMKGSYSLYHHICVLLSTDVRAQRLLDYIAGRPRTADQQPACYHPT